jgi:hypothetical protein
MASVRSRPSPLPLSLQSGARGHEGFDCAVVRHFALIIYSLSPWRSQGDKQTVRTSGCQRFDRLLSCGFEFVSRFPSGEAVGFGDRHGR